MGTIIHKMEQETLKNNVFQAIEKLEALNQKFPDLWMQFGPDNFDECYVVEVSPKNKFLHDTEFIQEEELIIQELEEILQSIVVFKSFNPRMNLKNVFWKSNGV